MERRIAVSIYLSRLGRARKILLSCVDLERDILLRHKNQCPSILIYHRIMESLYDLK